MSPAPDDVRWSTKDAEVTQFEMMERYLRAQMARKRDRPPSAGPDIRPFITISRRAGAGGHALAEALLVAFEAQTDRDLFEGWQVFDRRLCELVAEDPAYSHALGGLITEDYRSRTDEFFHQFLQSTVDQRAVMERVFRVGRAVASVGKAIVIGRAGSEVTRDLGHGLALRLVAPEEACLRGIMDFYDIDEKTAGAEAKRLDTARARLLRNHFGVDIEDPLLYDVVFNTGRIGVDEIAELVVVMVRQTADLSTTPAPV
jgi:cytidylate kinase